MKSLVAQAFLRAHAGMLDMLLWLFKLLWFRSLLGPCVPPGLPELHCSCEFRACCVQMWNPAAAQAHALCPRCSCGAGPCPQCAVTVLSVSPAQGRAGAAGCGCSSHTCGARLPPELPWARGHSPALPRWVRDGQVCSAQRCHLPRTPWSCLDPGQTGLRVQHGAMHSDTGVERGMEGWMDG